MVLPGPFRAAIIHRPGHPAFFAVAVNKPRKIETIAKCVSKRAQTRISREAIHLTRASFHRTADSREARRTIGLKHCDLSQLRQAVIERNNYIGYMKSFSRNSSQKKLSEMDDR